MNKAEMIEYIASQSDITKAQAQRAMEAFTGAVSNALKKGDSVVLLGFGTFSVATRSARSARNPRTGEMIQVKASKVPKFKPGAALKDALN